MISISGNTNALRLNPYGLSRFMSDVRTTSLCDDLPCRRRRAMQFDQPVRHELKGFAVLPVVVEERLLHRRVLGCLPSMPPNDRFEPGRQRARPSESEISGDLLQSIGERREIDLGVDE